MLFQFIELKTVTQTTIERNDHDSKACMYSRRRWIYWVSSRAEAQPRRTLCHCSGLASQCIHEARRLLDEFHQVDLRNLQNCLQVTQNCDWVFQLAACMRGMGFLGKVGIIKAYKWIREQISNELAALPVIYNVNSRNSLLTSY